ncbi:PilZ domain-containing protein [Novosphingobium sp. KACC 22771]|uniref:PilZ domain-containing protein n=1 Tax=Novosphingobium sp. KACC 22771 TaxID=3025670 RepID=UPI00236695C6|nr:PilZ domain-containing protein [Novosphingobium sp. KACC 22771]WDF71680.1 PilZ domain-containing protein [Novosphingobium sp. KACC 22771]
MSQSDTNNDPHADQRNAPRNNLLLSSICHWPNRHIEERVKIRNVSATGLMAEGTHGATVGEMVVLELRNIGAIEGIVAWVQSNRFGVAFARPIDPVLLRSPAEISAKQTETRDYYQRGPVSVLTRQDETRYDRLRRV